MHWCGAACWWRHGADAAAGPYLLEISGRHSLSGSGTVGPLLCHWQRPGARRGPPAPLLKLRRPQPRQARGSVLREDQCPCRRCSANLPLATVRVILRLYSPCALARVAFCQCQTPRLRRPIDPDWTQALVHTVTPKAARCGPGWPGDTAYHATKSLRCPRLGFGSLAGLTPTGELAGVVCC